MIKKRGVLLYGAPGCGKPSVLDQTKDLLEEVAAQVRQQQETDNFNHFLETGEVLPVDTDSDAKAYIEALAKITSLARPGPLSPIIPATFVKPKK